MVGGQDHIQIKLRALLYPHNPASGQMNGSYDPVQPQFRVPRKVVKGGFHLCAPSYRLSYRPSARRPQMIVLGITHIGFRCIVRKMEK